MKKLFCLLMIVVMLCALAACGTEKNAESSSPESPESVKPAGSIDVDLTELSSTMVYSEVYNMMYTPDDYIGKAVKMKGQFAVYQATDESGAPVPNQIYFACIIADATACCSQGLEFVLAGDHTYPEDYPEPGSEITVSGTFELYEENGFQYCRLTNAAIVH